MSEGMRELWAEIGREIRSGRLGEVGARRNTVTNRETTRTTYLVLDGVKMGAWVYLNGQLLGTVADQFLRYRYDVTHLLLAPRPAASKKNELRLVFPPSNHTLNHEARWMACSGLGC